MIFSQKKGVLGLSMETLVVVIISLVVLMGGIALMYKWVYGAESLKSSIDEQTNAELDRLLVEQGKQVALPRNVADVSRGENHIFGLGILNIGEKNNFWVEIYPPEEIADTSGNIVGVTVDQTEWLLFDGNSFPLEQGQSAKQFINVMVPKDASLGQYIFSVKVKYQNDVEQKQYGNTQKFTVNVKG